MTEIIDNFLFLGNKTDAENTQWLDSKNIKYILNVADEVEPLPQHKKYKYLHLHLDDYNFNQKFVTELPKAMEFIETAFKKGERVLVHCYAGVNRSATIVIWYLATRCGMGFDKAHAFVKLKRFYINPILLKVVRG